MYSVTRLWGRLFSLLVRLSTFNIQRSLLSLLSLLSLPFYTSTSVVSCLLSVDSLYSLYSLYLLYPSILQRLLIVVCCLLKNLSRGSLICRCVVKSILNKMCSYDCISPCKSNFIVRIWRSSGGRSLTTTA